MDYNRSIDSFSKVLELAPAGEDNNRVSYMRGRSYLKNRQYDQAIYDFTRALELTGEGEKNLRFLIYEMRGDAYFGKNAWLKKADPQRALADAKEALMLKPDEKRYDDLVYEIGSGAKRK